MPSFPNSRANVFVSPIVAARIEFDNMRFGIGCFTDYEVTVSTLPCSDNRSKGNIVRISLT